MPLDNSDNGTDIHKKKITRNKQEDLSASEKCIKPKCKYKNNI